MAARKKIAGRKTPKEATSDKAGNPWAAHGFKGDKSPFPGAGPPIHTRDGGKYHPHNRKKGKK